MAPPQKPWTQYKREKAGHHSLSSIFNKVRKRGRPKKSPLQNDVVISKKSRPKVVAAIFNPKKRRAEKAPAPIPKKKSTVSRSNWGKGEGLQMMTKAVQEWNERSGRYFDSNGEDRSLKVFANVVGIPYDSFKKYVCSSSAKSKRELGKQGGKRSLLDANSQRFIADVIARHDRGNDGKSTSESIDIVMNMNPKISRKQAADVFNRTIRPNNKDLLTQNNVTAQATTTKRSAITIPQQYRWFKTYHNALNELRLRNTGLCKLSGKTFGEVIHHFIFGGDESCMMASAGELSIVGSMDRKKHEKKIADSRVSITLYRTGSVAGSQGPTIALMKGKRRKVGYSDKFLVKKGFAEGSTIIMTPTAFVTEEAWEEMTPFVIKGIRSIDIIKANPQWWVLEVFDGFGLHVSSYKAMKDRYDNKILSLKEEGDSSHVNQAYDKFVAKSDKSLKRMALALLRNSTYKVVDQWSLVHVCLFIVRGTRPETWTTSFQACNMDPRVSIPFSEWCKKISASLAAGQTFKLETPIDNYALLPSWWHGTTPADKHQVFQVIESEHGFTPQCCIYLFDQCHIPYANQQILRVCYEMAKLNPEQLEMGIPSKESVEIAQDNPDVRAAYESAGHVTDGLEAFQLKPASKKGEELLDHMHAFALRDPKSKTEDDTAVKPSAYLDLSISSDQLKIIMQPRARDITMRELMRDAGGNGATMKIAKRKLSTFGAIQSHSGMANDERRLAQLRNKFELVASLAEINRLEKDNLEAKANSALMEKRTKAPAALAKLSTNNGKVKKLTKLEISALLLVHYSKDENDKSKSKPYLVDMLIECIEKQPDCLGAPVDALTVANPTQQPADSDSDKEQDDDDEPAGHTQEPSFEEDS
eukprot:scaffold120920_cov35-Attheya_sp.AAC.1